MSFIDRLNDEAIDLSGKLRALREFRASKAFDDLSHANQLLLSEQSIHMQKYLNILDIRLEILRGA